MPLEVNLVNLVDVLQKVTDVDNLGLHLGVPKHKLDKIRQDFHTTDERMREMLQWWLDHTLKPTWEKVKTALRGIGKPVLADAITRVSQCESLYEPCEVDSQRWEAILKMDQKLKILQQHSEDLEKEWKDFIQSQQMQQSDIFTPGFSHSELLNRYPQLEQEIQNHVTRSKELRGFYEKVTEHRRGLRKAATELKMWEKALIEHEKELQERIDQMDELGEKFSGEAKENS